MTKAISPQINWITKKFYELSLDELYRILQLREAVFILEQECTYTDLDNYDQKCLHLLGVIEGNIVAYARIFEPKLIHNEASFGRVLIEKKYRSFGIGHQLVSKLIEEINLKYKTDEIKIEAQAHLQNFYRQHGFISIGNEFLDAGIPHIHMIKQEPF